MPWVESHTVLARHRKLIELAKSLRLKPVYVLGHLHKLWHVALDQQEDGNLSSWTDDFLAAAADYDGDARQFVSLLELHGWLDNRRIHDWLDYVGRYLETKYRTSNPGRLLEILTIHGQSDSSLSKDRPPDRTGPDKKQEPLTPPQPVGSRRLSPRESGQSPRQLGINPKALAAKAASARAKYVEPPPPTDDIMSGQDFAAMREAVRKEQIKRKLNLNAK